MSTFDERGWARIQRLFDTASQWPSGEWSARLRQLEADDAVRAQVLALLEASEAEARASEAQVAASDVEAQPARIGPFSVIRLAGAGGRGRVFEAEREVAGVRQRVALKVMHEHLIAPKDLERFEREQRMLLTLDHPGIARFLEAGWEGGRPYFTMEWIDGQRVDEYCQQHRHGAGAANASVAIRLVVDLLDALHAAHRNLVVHLDLKPSNVLVDRNGRVRILDFGTAKLLHEHDETSTEQLTPRYSSPERLRGEAATTACDIYSVGLLLHEVVTGQWAFGHAHSIAALGERAAGMARLQVRTGSRDLDAVIVKSLRHEPEQRYSSAAAFAEDLRAYLEQRPVRARPASWWYTASRYAARHRAVVTVMAVCSLAVMLLAGYAWWQQRVALQEARQGQQIARFLSWMITSSATPGSGKRAMTVAEMVRRGSARMDAGTSLPDAVAANLQADFAFLTQEQGREDLAEPMARKAVQRADGAADVDAQLKTRATLADLLRRRGACDEAMEVLRAGDQLRQQFGKGLAPGRQVTYLVARAAASEGCQAKPEEAIGFLQAAMVDAAALPDEEFGVAPPVARAGLQLQLSLLLSRAGRTEEALQAAIAGLALAKSHPDGRYFQVALLRVRSQAHAVANRSAEAVADLREAARLAPGVVNPFEELRLRTMLAGSTANGGDCAGALTIARDALATARNRREEVGASFWMLVADTAEVSAKCGDCPDAEALLQEEDALTAGKLPRTWKGNQLFYKAECAARLSPRRAALLAQQALDTYGELLPAQSKRRVRILELISGKP
ncbi:MAG: serine/threonine protein kinase [Bryobacterales bacterium]|jgi:serine/threonine-protein kinase|nr:serine/threonine protein kinase [Bryobacterales bacterium]